MKAGEVGVYVCVRGGVCGTENLKSCSLSFHKICPIECRVYRESLVLRKQSLCFKTE